jgi:hypothetical protein
MSRWESFPTIFGTGHGAAFVLANTGKRLKAGGKPKYLLSGLLRCDVCDAHCTITNATSYGCSCYPDGRVWENSILVRRDRVENILLGPIRDGDPDMPEDELQAAIDRAEEKRRELQEQLSAYLPAKAFVFMSRAAELYRRQVTLGLDGIRKPRSKRASSYANGSEEKSGWSHCRMVVSRPTGIWTLARFWRA